MDMLEGRSTFNNDQLDARTATLLNEMEQEYHHWASREEKRRAEEVGDDWLDE